MTNQIQNKHKPWKCSCGYAGVDKNALKQHRKSNGYDTHKIVGRPDPESDYMSEADYQTWGRFL